jgi:hypothetical protein
MSGRKRLVCLAVRVQAREQLARRPAVVSSPQRAAIIASIVS